MPPGRIASAVSVPASPSMQARTVPSPPATNTTVGAVLDRLLRLAGAGVLGGRLQPRRLGPAGLGQLLHDAGAQLVETLDAVRVDDHRRPQGASAVALLGCGLAGVSGGSSRGRV